MTKVEDYIEEVKDDRPQVKDNEIEVKQESLAILATLGTTKEYLGVDMSLGDVKKLSVRDVEKYFNRYQAVMGKKISGGVVDSSLQLISKIISYLVPVDDIDALCNDLKNDDLVNCELTNIVGLLALKAGRLAALASGLFQVAKHVKIGKIQQKPVNSNTTDQETKQSTEGIDTVY